MQNRPHPARPGLATSRILPRAHPRPWPSLTGEARTKLAQQVARLIPRLRPAQEAPRVERAE
jgi:hypothetical protein